MRRCAGDPVRLRYGIGRIESVADLGTGGASIGLLASFNTVVANTVLSDRTSARIDANRDLLTHGLLNAGMGLFATRLRTANIMISELEQ